MRNAFIILAVFLVIGFLVAVSTVVFGFGTFSKSLPKGEGGIYEFIDGNFKQLPGSAGFRVNDFLFSKVNPDVIYVGTSGDGIWVSKDNGASFLRAQDKVFAGRVDIYDIEEDGLGNLYSSIYRYDENRGSLAYSSFPPESSAEIYFSSLPRFGVFGSSFDGGVVSVVSSDGGFYRSSNNGKSWELRSRQNEGLLKMESFLNLKYVLTSENKILLTNDFGKTWKDISPKDGSKNAEIKKFYLDKRTGFLLALADKTFISQSGGSSWREINLLVNPGELPIIALSMNPANSSTIYAVSEKILYKTIDGGSTWSIIEIPTAKKVSELFVDPKKPNSLFISTE